MILITAFGILIYIGQRPQETKSETVVAPVQEPTEKIKTFKTLEDAERYCAVHQYDCSKNVFPDNDITQTRYADPYILRVYNEEIEKFIIIKSTDSNYRYPYVYGKDTNWINSTRSDFNSKQEVLDFAAYLGIKDEEINDKYWDITSDVSSYKVGNETDGYYSKKFSSYKEAYDYAVENYGMKKYNVSMRHPSTDESVVFYLEDMETQTAFVGYSHIIYFLDKYYMPFDSYEEAYEYGINNGILTHYTIYQVSNVLDPDTNEKLSTAYYIRINQPVLTEDGVYGSYLKVKE